MEQLALDLEVLVGVLELEVLELEVLELMVEVLVGRKRWRWWLTVAPPATWAGL